MNTTDIYLKFAHILMQKNNEEGTQLLKLPVCQDTDC